MVVRRVGDIEVRAVRGCGFVLGVTILGLGVAACGGDRCKPGTLPQSWENRPGLTAVAQSGRVCEGASENYVPFQFQEMPYREVVTHVHGLLTRHDWKPGASKPQQGWTKTTYEQRGETIVLTVKGPEHHRSFDGVAVFIDLVE